MRRRVRRDALGHAAPGLRGGCGSSASIGRQERPRSNRIYGLVIRVRSSHYSKTTNQRDRVGSSGQSARHRREVCASKQGGATYQDSPVGDVKAPLLGLHCLQRATLSGEIFSGNLTFRSDSAWLTESHWSSCRLPGNANSSASKSASHDARSGRNTWPASNLAETTAMRLTLSPSGLTAIMPETFRRSS